uniref:Uncharacterized protein n=1 Tax=Corethron hystrix TaxID=216773 RepID=A0A7S1FVH3_9STRA|mmetsp:Transcript_31773/g.72970  ORF Transcript_31773/g.72970 Transcript_31773/m.72970 type:complete len:794 (+) Transcript_31773:214-2595(+)
MADEADPTRSKAKRTLPADPKTEDSEARMDEKDAEGADEVVVEEDAKEEEEKITSSLVTTPNRAESNSPFDRSKAMSTFKATPRRSPGCLRSSMWVRGVKHGNNRDLLNNITYMENNFHQRLTAWISSFVRTDPRHQIFRFFNDVAREGAEKIEDIGMEIREETATPYILRAFCKASAFSVWRPTSNEAIRKMMTGEGTGKGLDVKGKSAKKGPLSGFVPFMQIYEENHKKKVRWPPKNAMMRIYYKSEAARDYAFKELCLLSSEMASIASEAKFTLSERPEELKKLARTAVATRRLSMPPKEQKSLRILHKGLSTTKLRETFKKMMSRKISRVEELSTNLCPTVASQANIIVSEGKDERDFIPEQNISFYLKMCRSLEFSKKDGNFSSERKNSNEKKPRTVRFLFANRKDSDKKQKNTQDPVNFEESAENLLLDVSDSNVRKLDEYSPSCFGISVAQRIFFKAYISDQDIRRGPSQDTGRESIPNFQDMNFKCVRSHENPGPRAVVLQLSESAEEALRPQNLVVAYEECGKVLPVVSDFDCFLMGTRGVSYTNSLPKDQIELLKWLLTQIESVLDDPRISDENRRTPYEKLPDWTSMWLKVLKKSAAKGFYPDMPTYGFGDPKSYAIMESIVGRMTEGIGAVRHGPECFNYQFPQELDDEFLIICDNLPGNVPWKHVNVQELQDILHSKIDEGYSFPLNPKWILADQGWKALYDKMFLSSDKNIQEAMTVWYPIESGIRESIEDIHKRFPVGFPKSDTLAKEGTEGWDLAEQVFNEYVLQYRGNIELRGSLC